jgi:hypothetical protein
MRGKFQTFKREAWNQFLIQLLHRFLKIVFSLFNWYHSFYWPSMPTVFDRVNEHALHNNYFARDDLFERPKINLPEVLLRIRSIWSAPYYKPSSPLHSIRIVTSPSLALVKRTLREPWIPLPITLPCYSLVLEESQLTQKTLAFTLALEYNKDR